MIRFPIRTSSTIIPIRALRCLISSSFSSVFNDKLFVGGLSSSVDNEHLVEAFSSFGGVTDAMVVYDKVTGRSRGYGFVRFSDEHAASAAKDAMDGRALLGKPITIRFALERARGGPIVVPRLFNSGDPKA